MANNATVSLYGTVTNDPTNQQTKNNNTWLKLKVAVQTTKPSNDVKFPHKSDFYDVNMFGKFAETIQPTVKKGCKVYIVGDLQMGEPWTGQNGETHVTPQVYANKLIVASGGNWNNGAAAPAEAQAPAQEETLCF